MKEKLLAIKESAEQMLASDMPLEEIRVRFLGKKGELTAVLRGMGSLSAEERPVIGALANEVRQSIEAQIEARAAAKKAKNYAEADRIRAALLEKGVVLQDTPNGTKYQINQ